jgi:cytoskeleton protein RodZ
MDSASDNTRRDEAPRSPGAILAAERERQGLARADVAQRLHMSVSQVEALELADYPRLPRGTFLRGFTRNYARTLGLDPEPLVDMLTEDAPRERVPEIVVPTQNIRFDPLGQRLGNPYVKAAGIAAALVVLGFAAMYWWLFIRPNGVATSAATVVKKPAIEAPRRVAPAPPPAEAPVAEASTTPVEQPVAQSPAPVPARTAAAAPDVAASAPALAPAPAPAPAEPLRAAGPGEGAIRLAFRGAAWVEITDARGKVLLSRTHAGGSSADVVGRPPFNLVIGNAPEVRLTYNGREVDLVPHTRVAVARFTLP